MLIVVIVLDHTIVNVRVVILAMAKFVIKVCLLVHSVAVAYCRKHTH